MQSDQWINRLEEFLQQSEFYYSSPTTLEAEQILFEANSEYYSKNTINTLDQFISKSINIDNKLLFGMSDYISMRLMQIAWQREYGTFRSYSDVTIKYSDDIKYASQLLRPDMKEATKH